MAKRKSGGQSQGPPKQAAGGGASRSPTANMQRPANGDYTNSSMIVFRHTHILLAQKLGNGPSLAKPPTSSGLSSAQLSHFPNERLIACW